MRTASAVRDHAVDGRLRQLVRALVELDRREADRAGLRDGVRAGLIGAHNAGDVREPGDARERRRDDGANPEASSSVPVRVRKTIWSASPACAGKRFWSRSTARCESVFGSEKLFAFRLPTACESARTPTARTIQEMTTIRRCAIVQRVSVQHWSAPVRAGIFMFRNLHEVQRLDRRLQRPKYSSHAGICRIAGSDEQHSRAYASARSSAHARRSPARPIGSSPSAGDHATTLPDIAEAADVSTRTIFAYFPSKEDILFSDFPLMKAALAKAFAERPEGEEALETVRAFILSSDGVEKSELDEQLGRRIESDATLRSHLRARIAEARGIDRCGDREGHRRSGRRPATAPRRRVPHRRLHRLDRARRREITKAGRRCCCDRSGDDVPARRARRAQGITKRRSPTEGGSCALERAPECGERQRTEDSVGGEVCVGLERCDGALRYGAVLSVDRPRGVAEALERLLQHDDLRPLIARLQRRRRRRCDSRGRGRSSRRRAGGRLRSRRWLGRGCRVGFRATERPCDGQACDHEATRQNDGGQRGDPAIPEERRNAAAPWPDRRLVAKPVVAVEPVGRRVRCRRSGLLTAESRLVEIGEPIVWISAADLVATRHQIMHGIPDSRPNGARPKPT